MKLSTMVFLERYVGIPFILLIRLFRHFLVWRRKRPEFPESVQTIMIEKFFGTGSIVNAIPMINEVRKRFPSARIVFLTFPAQAHFVRLANVADLVLIVDPANVFSLAATSAKSIVRLLAMRVDICIDLEYFSKFSMILSCLSGAPVRVGYTAYFQVRSPLVTHPAVFNHYRHISQNYLSMAAILGAEVDDTNHRVELPSQLDSHGFELDAALGDLISTPVVAVNVNSSELCPLRSWPDENFIQLIPQLMEAHSAVTFVMVGSKSERAHVEDVISKIDAPPGQLINIAGRTSMGALMALLEKAVLLITTDSGPAHLAAGYRTPTVVLFGPETPTIYRPLNDNASVLYKQVHCSPCINVLDNKSYEDCHDPICMTEITVFEVMVEADKIIREARSSDGKDGEHDLGRPHVLDGAGQSKNRHTA